MLEIREQGWLFWANKLADTVAEAESNTYGDGRLRLRLVLQVRDWMQQHMMDDPLNEVRSELETLGGWQPVRLERLIDEESEPFPDGAAA